MKLKSTPFLASVALKYQPKADVSAYVNFQSLPVKITYSLITSISLLLCIREKNTRKRSLNLHGS